MRFIVSTNSWSTKSRVIKNFKVEAAAMMLAEHEGTTPALVFEDAEGNLVATFVEWDAAWQEDTVVPLSPVEEPHGDLDQ